MKKIALRVVLIFLLNIFFISLWSINSFVFQKDYTYKISFDSIDNGIQYKVYYTNESNERYSEKKSLLFTKLSNGDQFVHHQITIDDSTNISKIRLDFGYKPGNVIIKNLNVIGRSKMTLNLNDINIYKINQIDQFDYQDSGLTIFSSQKDPYINFGEIDLDPRISFKFNYLFIAYYIFFNVVLSILLHQFKDWLDTSILYILLVFSFLMSSFIFTDSNKVSISENRNLSSAPQILPFSEFNRNDFENWLNDHFAFREVFININNTLSKIDLLNIYGGIYLDSDKTIVGNDHWLFYKKEKSINNYQNLKVYSDDELTSIYKNITEISKYFDNKGIKFYVLIGPDKNNIYGEYFPNTIKKSLDIRAMDQLYDYIITQEYSNFIYPKNSLLEAKENGHLYYKNDTHWTSYGAFLAYIEMIKNIENDFKNINSLNFNDVRIFNEQREYGDLSNSKLNNSIYKDIQYLSVENLEKNNFTYKNNSGREGVHTINNYPLNKMRVLMFRDSFTTNMIPFISETFKEVEYIWDYNIHKNINKIENYKPDIIILELVERNQNALKLNDMIWRDK